MRFLHVGLGTTGGWRHADRTLAAELRRRGHEVRLVWPTFTPLARRLGRRYQPLSGELIESLAIRVALGRHAHPRPDWIVLSSSTALTLLPRGRRGDAILWTDTPTAIARTGRRAAPLHWRERFATPRLRAAAIQPVRFVDDFRSMFPGIGARAFPLPVPVREVGRPRPERDRCGLIYAGNPRKKGLDLAIRAWVCSGTDATLYVTGIEAETAERFVAGSGIDVPPNVRLLGRIAPDEHRALSSRAAVYLSCSRREEYGNAQLEALVDGAMLVCGPTVGTAEPRAVAEAIAPGLVTQGGPDAVGRCVATALAMAPDEVAGYQTRAREVMRDYGETAFSRAVDSLLEELERTAR